MAQDFYPVFGTVSFTLLGLWIIVVQTRYADWASDPARLRTSYAVFLNFALPGTMAIVSLVEPGNRGLWRCTFVIAALLGVAGAVYAWGRERGDNALLLAARAAGLVLYVVIALVALFASTVADDLELKPLEIEAVLLSLMILLDLNVAWTLLIRA